MLKHVLRVLQGSLKDVSPDVQLQIGLERITNAPEGTVANKTM